MWERTTSRCRTANRCNWARLNQSSMSFIMRIPLRQRGSRAASMHFVKVQGDNARPNGRTRYWYALPPKVILRYFLWYERMDMWKYASLRSIVTNQSLDLICGTICLKVNILNLSCLTSWVNLSHSELKDRKWDATPHPSLELWNTGCKTRFPCWSEVHILWPLSLTELSLLVRGGKSTKIFYSSKSTITLITFYLSTSKITSLKIYSSKK